MMRGGQVGLIELLMEIGGDDRKEAVAPVGAGGVEDFGPWITHESCSRVAG